MSKVRLVSTIIDESDKELGAIVKKMQEVFSLGDMYKNIECLGCLTQAAHQLEDIQSEELKKPGISEEEQRECYGNVVGSMGLGFLQHLLVPNLEKTKRFYDLLTAEEKVFFLTKMKPGEKDE